MEVGNASKTKEEIETEDECLQGSAKLHLHCEEDHIEWDEPEKVEIHYDDANELCIKVEEPTIQCEELNELNKDLKKNPAKKRYICHICGEECKNAFQHLEHLRSHNEDLPHVCGICSKGFLTSSNLTNHIKIHKGENIHTCSFCSMQFNSVKVLQQHIKDRIFLENENGESTNKRHGFKCDICLKIFETCDTLTRHVRTVHMNSGYCDLCGENFSTKHLCRQHTCSCGSKLHKCTVCGSSFLRAHNLQQHMKVHTDRTPTQHPEHVRAHNKGLPHICGICSKGFLTSGSLANHIKVHKDENIHTCSVCSMQFDSVKALQQHIKDCIFLENENGESTNKRHGFECNICLKIFGTCDILTRHVRTVHMNSGYCDFCGENFPTTHLFRRHTCGYGPKPHKCTVCGSSFTRAYNLQQHMKVHTNRTPAATYPCHICGESFSFKVKLQMHVKTHSGERLYECHICGEKMESKYYVKVHIEKKHRVTCETLAEKIKRNFASVKKEQKLHKSSSKLEQNEQDTSKSEENVVYVQEEQEEPQIEYTI